MALPSQRAMPPALTVGLAIAAIGVVVRVMLYATELDGLALRLYVADVGLHGASWALICVGLFELARTTTGRTHRALQVAVVAIAFRLVWSLFAYFVPALFDDRWQAEAFRWGTGIGMVVALIGMVALIHAASAWRQPESAVLGLFAILAPAWLHYLANDMQRWLLESRGANLVFWTVIGATYVVAVWRMTAAIAREAISTPQDAARATAAFRRSAAALRFAVIALVAVAFVAAPLVLRTPWLIEVVGVIGPVVVIACMLVAALGFLVLASSGVEGLPVLRVVVGAAVTLWWTTIQLVQLAWHHQPWENMAGAWSVAGPLIGAAGLALVGSAIGRFAAARHDDTLREMASVRTVVMVVLLVASTGITTQIDGASGLGGLVTLAFAAAGAKIAALIVLAGLLTRAAAQLGQAPSLPTARVVSDD